MDVRSGTRDVKGKGRASDVHYEDIFQGSSMQRSTATSVVGTQSRSLSRSAVDHHAGNDALTHSDSLPNPASVHTPNPSNVTAERTKPRIRRDAWNTVQAHLANPPSSRSTFPIPVPDDPNSSDHLELSVKGAALALASQLTAPSCLAASSHADTRRSRRNKTSDVLPLLQRLSSPNASTSPESHSVPDAHTLHSSVLRDDQILVSQPSNAPTPDVTVATRSRSSLARITSEFHHAKTPPDAMETDELLPVSSHSIDDASRRRVPGQLSGPSSSYSNSLPTGSPHDTSDHRARLLNKLQDEKRLQQLLPMAVSELSNAPTGTHSVTSISRWPEGVISSTTGLGRPAGAERTSEAEVEENLRRQARLRARLASEKRTATGRAEEPAVANGNDEAPSLREATLRERLKQLRT